MRFLFFSFVAVFSTIFLGSSVCMAETKLPAMPVEKTLFMSSDADFSELNPRGLNALINANIAQYPSYVVLRTSSGLFCYMFDSFSLVGVAGSKTGSWNFWTRYSCNSVGFFWNGSSWESTTPQSYDCTVDKQYVSYVTSTTDILFNSSDILELDSGVMVSPAYALGQYLDYGYTRDDVANQTPDKDEEDEPSLLDWVLKLPSLIWDLFKISFNYILDYLKNIDSFLKNVNAFFIDLLSYLFVPEESPFSMLEDQFNEKFPIIGQLTDCVKVLFSKDSYYNVDGASQTSDELNNGYDTGLNLSFKWHGKLYRLNGFEWLNTYGILKLVRTTLMAFLWTAFAVRMYKKLPAVISGLHT